MGESGQRASSLVVGMSSHCRVLDTSKFQSAMGVLFWPGGARAFFDAPADMFHNENVPLELIWGPLSNLVRDHLREISKHSYSLSGPFLSFVQRRHFHGFDKGPHRRFGWWDQNVVLCQKAPQMGILLS